MSASEEEDYQHEQDAALERARANRKRRNVAFGIGTIVILLIWGVMPTLFGQGVFGIRACNSQTVTLWMYNPTSETLRVEVGRVGPLAGAYVEEEIPALGIGHHQVVSGEHELRWSVGDGGAEQQRVTIDNDLMLNAGEACFAVFDISAIYTDGGVAPDHFPIVARVPADQRVYSFEGYTNVGPRQLLPTRSRPPVHWIEDFDCALLEPENEELLQIRAMTTIDIRNQQRN